MQNRIETATGYLSISSDAFQQRLSALLSPFEYYEHKVRYEIVETYDELDIEPVVWKMNIALFKKSKGLTRKERKMIDDYLAAHGVTECETDKTSYEIDTYESLILEPYVAEI